MKKTFVKEPFKAGGKFYPYGQEVSFSEDITKDFIARGLLTTETIVVEEPEGDEAPEITESDVNKMTGNQLKNLIKELGLKDIDVTVAVKDLKAAVVDALFNGEDDEVPGEEPEGDDL